MPPPTRRSAEADAIFLTALENGHSVRIACRMARYARRSVYRWRGEYPDFAARWTTVATCWKGKPTGAGVTARHSRVP